MSQAGDRFLTNSGLLVSYRHVATFNTSPAWFPAEESAELPHAGPERFVCSIIEMGVVILSHDKSSQLK